ncbi:MAG: hypothetical protein WCP06_08385 [Verrucomicrobiota bacterium]
MVDESAALAERIERGIREQGRYFVSSPAEMAQFGDINHAVEFAKAHGWILLCHLGGTNYEFFEAVPSEHQALY